MAKAKWARVSPGLLAALTPMPGGTMVMATLAKKHMTIFTRSRRAVGAGRPEVKAAFKRAAEATRGEPDRVKRNAAVSSAMLAAGLKTGVYKRKSRAGPKSPLFGTVYTIKAKAA